ncbi:hypothetical protein pipiens_005242 [Culex pipiens pipiens]|uniref:RRM domain-containing protein n=2 Tax=Culex pipiens TaxID=7175 RepID=A0ABD1DYA4_CULPP
MSEEDERTLWCGNLSDKVTEELLYELFVQAGPVQLVKIPRDNEKRQRSYAFITYGHAASVEYAIEIFEGTKLFQRPLTLHKKSKNGPNPAASPKVNFNSNQRGQQQFQNQNQNQQQFQNSPGGMRDELLSQLNLGSDMMNPALVGQMMANMQELIMQQMNQPMQQQQNHQGKMNHRNNRSHHQQQPYSRGDNNRGGGGDGQQMYSRDRNDGQMYSRDRGGRNRNGGGSGGGGGGGGGGNQNRRNDYRGRR